MRGAHQLEFAAAAGKRPAGQVEVDEEFPKAGDTSSKKAEDDEAGEDSPAEHDEAKSIQAVALQETLPEWFTGWDAEQEQAWRVLARDADDERLRQYTDKILYDERAAEEQFVKAVWKDGFVWEVACLTVGQWKARLTAKAACKRGRSAPPLWESKGFFVREKSDRRPLLWIGKNDNKQKQLCQVRIDLFESRDAALALVIKLATAMATGDCAHPYETRDRLLRELGLLKTGPGKASGKGKLRGTVAPAGLAARQRAASPSDDGLSICTTPKPKPKRGHAKADLDDFMSMDFSEDEREGHF